MSIIEQTSAIKQIIDKILQFTMSSGLNILTAIVFFAVGFFVIKWLNKIMELALTKKHIDKTLGVYIVNSSRILLYILLIAACMGFLGVQTTTFAAIIGASGLAISMAWSGLLSNFAAGAFLLFLRPFKVGDVVMINNITGTVKEIGIFSTSINTPDGVQTIIGNNSILTTTIRNFSTNEIRRVDINFQVPAGCNIDKLSKKLLKLESEIPNVLADPAPEVVVSEFRPIGPIMTIKAYCNNEFYWTVYNDTSYMLNRNIPVLDFKNAGIYAANSDKQ